MAKKLTDLNQLTKAILKESPHPAQSPEGAATRDAADERIAELERQLAEEREAHIAAVRERDRLQGECGRLQGELRKCGEKAPVSAPVEAAPVLQSEPPKPTQLSPEVSAEPRSGRYAGCILAAPATAAEVFPGEVREQVVATLLDGLGTAERSGRERRAEILRYVLAYPPGRRPAAKRAATRPKKKAVFQPKPVKDDFLAKLRLHRKRYGW